ncbi:methionine synthase [Candidatus Cyanaurora vandensis]|uniref:methionine synthase n=1 Tax=Candidatus Cyanaurora vandensis TaxID=2714958 RepID=UPI00257D479B|nr:methionine synthase [Candidatus Cyanaurora vandensis]
MPNFLELLQKRILVFDGAMGTSIQNLDLSPDVFGGKDLEGCNEYLVKSAPQVIRQVHRSFLEAGADVIETDTFGSTGIVLADYDIAPLAYELNFKAAEIAKQVAQEFSTPDQPRFVAGSMGPTNKMPTFGGISFREMVREYHTQVLGLLDGGVDLLLVETCFDLLQTKAALNAIFQAFKERKIRLPVIASLTFEPPPRGTMLAGSDIATALAVLSPYPIDVLGLNCATGPEHMAEHIHYLANHSPFAISVVPNAGLPENIGGHTHYHLSPAEMVTKVGGFVRDLGVNIVGGCCGTTPAHIQALAQAVKGLTPVVRRPERLHAVASLYNIAPLHMEPGPVMVGERLNANGSKQFKDLLLVEDWDGMVAMARAQEKEGAHLLDVCVDYVGRDGVQDMTQLIERLKTAATLPLMIDSTELPVLEAALEQLGSRAVVNSINLEDGEERMARVLPMCREFGAAVVALTIDEDREAGMAKTADRKLAIAQRIYDLAVHKYGMAPEDLIFDPLTFTLATGNSDDRRLGLATLEGIKLIKENLPGVKTILGLSNISFGLKPKIRHVLNSVYLYYALQSGLDMAIVHASKILPVYRIGEEEKELHRRLIFDDWCAGDPLQNLLHYYSENEGTTQQQVVDQSTKTLEERLTQRIIDGNRVNLTVDLQAALDQGHTPLIIINQFLLEGMKVVGDLFGSGQMQLPFVLQSAETMKAAVSYLETFMEKAEGSEKGTLVIATVKGDVHDIGKNLVNIILTNNGYKVHDLGIKQPVEGIIQAIQDHQPDCVGMSGLLVKSTVIMKENLQIFNERGITLPVILGGAALTRRFVEEDCQRVYHGKLAYGLDAFAGLHFLDRLMNAKAAQQWSDTLGFLNGEPVPTETKPVIETGGLRSEKVQRRKRQIGVRSQVALDIPRPTPPFWGSRIFRPADLDLTEVFQYLDLKALVAGQWQFRKQKDQTREQYEQLVQEKMMPVLHHWQTCTLTENLLSPHVAYGYFPCQAREDELLVYGLASFARYQASGDPSQLRTLVKFRFPRQQGQDKLCISDFYAPVGSGQVDVLPLQAVTAGLAATTNAQQLYEANNYSDYLYFAGLAVQTAEALADWIHTRIRHELGVAGKDAPDIARLISQGYQGSRYSFGYPACPNIADQRKLLYLLRADRIHLTMDEHLQLHPEQSTTALVSYHPAARYFSA